MILVFGSLNMDLIIRVPGLPARGETVLAPGHLTAPGGKGANQAVAAARAGARVRMAGCVGPDQYGRELIGIMDEAGVDTGPVGIAREPTGLAIIAVDAEGENQILVSSGANFAARQESVAEDVLRGSTTLLLQLEVPPEENAALARRARARGVRVILNAAPAGPVELESLDILIVNEVEAAAVAAARGMADADPVAFAHRVADSGGPATVVTLGARGAVAVGPDGKWKIGSLAIRPVDTVGAGDAFAGTLASALDGGTAMPDALRRASVAGALACLEHGAMPSLPRAAAVDARLEELAPAVPF